MSTSSCTNGTCFFSYMNCSTRVLQVIFVREEAFIDRTISPVGLTLHVFLYFAECLCSSDHGFIAYDTNIIMNYDNSPRKQKFTDISLATNSPKSPRRTLESSCKLENTLTEESSHLRQGSHLSGVSGQDSEDYDSDSMERFGSGWDTLYHMRSSFRSKMKDKENFSKSVEPRSSVKDSLREACNYTSVFLYTVFQCRIQPWRITCVHVARASSVLNFA